MNPRPPLSIVASLGAAFAVACGGAQGGNDRIPWSNAFDAVPADARYAYAADLRSADADALRASWSTLAGSPGMESVRDELEHYVGVSFDDASTFEQLGLDLEGDYAVFSTSLAPLAVFRLADSEAFDLFLADVVARNPDVEWRTTTVAGTSFRTGVFDPVEVDFGIRADYAIVRLRTGIEGIDVDDDRLASFLRSGAADSLAATPRVRSMLARANDGEVPVSFGVVDTDAIADALEIFWTTPEDVASLDALGLTGLEGSYSSDEQRETCQAEAARVVSSIPWAGVANFRNASDDTAFHGTYVLHFADETAQRAAGLFRGMGTTPLDHADEAALFAGANIALADLLAVFDAPHELRDCPNIASIPGWISYGRGTQADEIADLLRHITGAVALGVFDVRMSGFVPRVEAVLMLGSPEPPLLTTAFQRLLESSGASGTVDEGAAYTTLRYDLLGTAFEIVQMQDRVVFAIGEIPPGLSNALAEAPLGVDGDPFAVSTFDGPRVAHIVEGFFDLLTDTGGLPNEQLSSMRRQLQTYEAMLESRSNGHFDGNDLVVDTTLIFDPSRLDPTSGD